jgi:GT2 family glycosyltransferase
MLDRTPTTSTGVPQAAWLADGLALLTWRQAGGEAVMPRLDSQPLPRPYASARLDDAGQHALLLRVSRAASAGGLLQLGADARHAPALAVEEIAPRPQPLLATLDRPARARLLGFLLEVGGGLFRVARQPGFVQACRQLAAGLAEDGDAPAQIAALLPDGGQLVVVPDAVASAGWHLLAEQDVRSLPATAGAGGTCLLASRAATGAGRVWRLAASQPPHVLAWLEDRPPAEAAQLAAFLRASLGVRKDAGVATAALLRELSLLLAHPARRHQGATSPVGAALELALPDGAGGLFLRGWLRDPQALVQDMHLDLPWGRVPVPHAALKHVPRPDLAPRFARAAHGGEPPTGFVAHLPDIGGMAPQPELALGLASGAVVTLRPPLRTLAPAAARDAVLGSVPPSAAEAAMADCLAPAAARLHAAAMGGDRATQVIRIGTPPARPNVSVLIPLYRTLSFLRAQLACFACDPAWREVETIFVLDSPEQRAEVEHLLRGLSLMHGLPVTLVVMPRNLGYAAANNAGAAVARAKLLLLLNSDVVPDSPGWLAQLRAPLSDRRIGAAGPKLLFEDSSIQHAGLFFDQDADGTWFNRHYFKGFPRGFAPACRPRTVPGVTGAALLVRRSLFEKLGGITEDYIIGDYEDSDFCLKLRAAGADIAYVPGAELWHFERRSISTHQGYTRTLASLYNRRLHHARWGDAIAALMGAGRAA